MLEEGESADKNEPADKQLEMLENVQFIYELALAQLELQVLGARFELTNGLRKFRLLGVEDEERLRRRLAYFKAVRGEQTDYFQIIQRNRTRSVNQYLTHWIYPYKGKFHPQMIRALLNILGLERGETVLDPFVGSGTTAVEAELLGINCVGIDVSPLCVLQTRVKTESVAVLPEIEEWRDEILKRTGVNLFNIENKSLDAMINSISNEKVRNFYKLAELVAISDSARRKKEFFSALRTNLDLMVSSVKDFVEVKESRNLELGKVCVVEGDARDLSLSVDSESIDGIVTSPPYSIALDYVANDAHALKALGSGSLGSGRRLGYSLSEIREKFMGLRGKGVARIKLYNEDLRRSLEEMFRVLKPGKFAAVVVGNATYLGKEVKTVEFTINSAEAVGFRLVRNIDKIIFGLYNVMQKEKILIFTKEGA
ncbi:hypothetical protein B6V00_01140 [ANME-1 cluster archaeon ex4572_4]|nr:MAG: hypothetical protein B6V00_01140 [ANME-1 cluster archaeon ex4572_4]